MRTAGKALQSVDTDSAKYRRLRRIEEEEGWQKSGHPH